MAASWEPSVRQQENGGVELAGHTESTGFGDVAVAGDLAR
jgi:hypothetical protein